MSRNVVCLGALIVDIINAPLDRMLAPGELAFTTVGLHLGGCAHNVAVNMARLGLRRCQIACIGAVGADCLGEYFVSQLRMCGISSRIQVVADSQTSKNIILQIADQERRYYFDQGANSRLSLCHVMDALRALEPELLYVGELSCLGELGEALPELLREAKRMGSFVVVDIVKGRDQTRKALLDAASLVDLFHCNESEATWLTGLDNAMDALISLRDLGIPTVFVSQGQGPLLVAHQGKMRALPSFEVPLIDATGAGDAFTAGVITQLVEQHGLAALRDSRQGASVLRDATRFGQAAGAMAVTALGCTTAVSLEKVRGLLENGTLRSESSSGALAMMS